MKKLAFKLSFLTLALAILASCSSEDMLDKSIEEPGSFPLTSTMTVQVFSLNWANGKTCPGETLDLQVSGGRAPYTWTVMGASIISGQGTPYLKVKVNESPESANDIAVFFRATDSTGNNKSLSGWADEQTCRFFCEEDEYWVTQPGICTTFTGLEQ